MPTLKITAAFVESVKPPLSGQLDYWDARLSGFGLRVSAGGTKSWFVFYRYNRANRRYTLGRFPSLGLADARKKAAGVIGKAQAGLDPASEKRAARDESTFAELAKLYIERHAKLHKRTWREDQRIINRELLPAWRHAKASGISRRDVIALIDRIVDRKAGIQANRTKALVSKIYNFGISRGLVENNPAYRVENPVPERQRDRVLSRTELQSVWKALDGESPQMAAIFKLGLLTAQRRGEILGMMWEELDMVNHWWTIPGHRTKNGLPHRVPLTAEVLEIIKNLPKPADKPCPYVFPGPQREPHPRHTLQKPLRSLRKTSKVDFRFHDLRRTAATIMTGVGVPRLVVAKILNHVERGITAVYDRHSYDNEKRRALVRLEQRIIFLLRQRTPAQVLVLKAG